MSPTQLRTILVLLVWLIVAIAGASFIRSAFRGRKTARNSRLAATVGEIRFRLRLAFGLLLLLLVVSGVFWTFSNGIK